MAEQDEHSKKDDMLKALEKSLGVVTTAAKAANVSRGAHYQWLDNDTKYKKAVVDLKRVALDFAESKLHKAIDKGNIAEVIFFLKCQGKGRGYIERQEVDNMGTIEHVGKVAIFRLPENGREVKDVGPEAPKKADSEQDAKQSTNETE